MNKQHLGEKNCSSEIHSSYNPWTKTMLLSTQLYITKQLKKKPKQLSFRQ